MVPPSMEPEAESAAGAGGGKQESVDSEKQNYFNNLRRRVPKRMVEAIISELQAIFSNTLFIFGTHFLHKNKK